MAIKQAIIVSTLVVTQLATLAYGTCTTFDPIQGYNNYSSGLTYTSIGASMRISEVVVCSTDPANRTRQDSYITCDSDECSLSTVPNLLFNVDSTLNVSLPLDQTRDILALVKSNLSELAGKDRYNFNVTQTYTSTGVVSMCIPQNSTHYTILTPYTICSTGYLSGCSGDGAPADGTVITACGIETLSFRSPSGIPNIDGVISSVVTNGADNLPAPENTTDVITNVQSSDSSNTSSSNTSDSGASSYSAVNSVWLSIVAVTAAFWTIC